MALLLKEVYVAYDPEDGKAYRDINIYVEDGVIVEVSERVPPCSKGDHVVDCRRKIVLPGFANAHTHLGMTVLRGYADDLSLHEWLNNRIWPAERRLRPHHVYIGAKLASLELLHAGVTAAADMYFYEDQAALAAVSLGLRVLAAPAVFADDFMDATLGQAVNTIKSVGGNQLLKWAIGPHSTYSCDADTLAGVRELAEEMSLKVHMHVGESRRSQLLAEKTYGKREFEALDEMGLLSARLIAAHSVWITKREVALIGKAGASVVFCPVSNSKLAEGGVAPIPELLGQGVNVCLGTDGAASNNSLDIHETMKYGSLIVKNHRWDPTVLDAKTCIRMATTNGYRALGFPLHSPRAGCAADLITIPMSPSLCSHPSATIPSRLVYSTISVADVVVNGEPVMLDSVILKADEAAVMEEFEKAAEDLAGVTS